MAKEMNTKLLIFTACLLTALYYSKVSAPQASEVNPLESELNRFRDSLLFERHWNEKLMANNTELYNELLVWTNHANRIKRMAGVPDSIDFSYQVKCQYHVETRNLVGQNAHPSMKTMNAWKRNYEESN